MALIRDGTSVVGRVRAGRAAGLVTSASGICFLQEGTEPGIGHGTLCDFTAHGAERIGGCSHASCVRLLGIACVVTSLAVPVRAQQMFLRRLPVVLV